MKNSSFAAGLFKYVWPLVTNSHSIAKFDRILNTPVPNSEQRTSLQLNYTS